MAENMGPGPERIEPGQPDFRVDTTGLVSRTFGLWGRKLPGYICISAIAAIGLTAMEFIVFFFLFGPAYLVNIGRVSADPTSFLLSIFVSPEFSSFVVVMAVLMIVEMVIYAIVGGAMTKLALDNYGSPQAGKVGESVSFAVGRVPTLIGSQLVLGLISAAIMVPLLLVMFSVIMIDPFSPGAFNVLILALVVMVVSLAAVVYVGVRFAPLVGVVIGAGLSTVESLKRSISITSHRFWHIFGARILLTIVVFIVEVVIQILISPTVLYSALLNSVLYGVIVALFMSPLDYVFQAVLYKDLMSRGSVESQQQWW